MTVPGHGVGAEDGEGARTGKEMTSAISSPSEGVCGAI